MDKIAEQQFAATLQAIGDRLNNNINRILDFGAGANRYSSRLAKRFGCRVLAVDIVFSYARHYRGDANVEYRCSTNGIVPAADHSVDLIWCFLVLGGLPEQELPHAIHEFQRVLRPGGTLVLVENVAPKPDAPHWSYRSVMFHQRLLVGWQGGEVGRFNDFGEEIAVMVFKSA